VAQLDAANRAKLPNSAFAYIDSHGKRRLPIHDAAHVRNALARFGQVHFEDDAARDRARDRLLRAAKRFGIVPVGFITGQLESERERGTRGAVILPSGFVTMLLTDIEASTALLERLGDGYGDLLTDVRSLLQDSATARQGSVVETRADEFFAASPRPPPRSTPRSPSSASSATNAGRMTSRSACGSGSTAAIRRSRRPTTSAWPCTPRLGSRPRRTVVRS
jgi:class 3 adenylate cyclase